MAGLSGQIVRAVNLSVFSRNSTVIFNKFGFIGVGKQCSFSTDALVNERDPAPLFFNEEVQKLLKVITRPDPKIVFRTRKDGHEITDPKYKFMTNEELDVAMKEAYKRLDERLQMPPVVAKRKEITDVLSKDPALQGHDEAKFAFTDISFGSTNIDRLIVVRDPDGKLRKADWNERFRMNQIYFPIEGREIFTPRMFEDEYLQDIIKRKDYEFILDRACIQFEPDDPDYQRITTTVYDAVDSAKDYDKLRSTRHYGPFVFYLTITKNIDNLLYENITREFIEDASLLIKLFHKIHPASKSYEESSESSLTHEKQFELIKKYIELDSSDRGKLTSAINAYKEISEARKKVDEGIKKAHGFD